MVKPEHEYFIRFYLLLIKGGGEVLRQIITWGLERQKLTLDQFLTQKEDSIRKLDCIKQKEIDILYPVSPDVSDLSKWDISLLSCIAYEFFRNVLSTPEIQAVQKIRDMRNEYSHNADASIDFNTYIFVWTELTLIINTMAHAMGGSKQMYLVELISNASKKEEIDMKSAIEELRTLDRTEELLKSLSEFKREMSEMKKELQEMREIKKEFQDLKMLLESLGKSIDITNKSRGAIHVTADDKNIEDAAGTLLFDASNESVSKAKSSESHPAVREKVDMLVKDIEEKGVKVDEVKQGSVIFTFTCPSLTALLDLIDFFESDHMQKHLEDISGALEDILGQKVQLVACMLPVSLQHTLQMLRGMTETRTRSVQFSMTCEGIEGLEHAFDVFEDDAASNSLNSLAKALSEEVGKPVTLQTSIDIEQMQKAIQSTRQQLENELRNNQTRRNGETVEAVSVVTEREIGESSAIEIPDTETACPEVLDLPGQEEGKPNDSGMEFNSAQEGVSCKNYGKDLTTELEACPDCDRGPKAENELQNSPAKRNDETVEPEDGLTESQGGSGAGEAQPIATSSEMSHDFACTSCLNDGRSTEAYKYCVECQSYFCETCLNQHSKFPPLQRHIILEKDDVRQLPVVALPSQFCSEHPGNIIQVYCKEHDVVCCTVCIAVDHRLCQGVDFIPKIAKGLLAGKEKMEVETSLEGIRKDLGQLKLQMKKDLDQLNNVQYDILKQIQNYKARINARLNDLERKSAEQVRTRYKDIAEKINDDTNALEDMLKTVDIHIKNMTHFKGENEAQLFVYIKHGQKLILRCLESIRKVKDAPIVSLKFDFSYDIEMSLNDMQTFVTMPTDNSDKTPLVGEYDIKLQSDICNVSACCFLKDGTLVITDQNNNRLKRLDNTYRVMDWCDAPGGPSGLCEIESGQVAVSMYSGQKVQFFSISENISLQKSFAVKEGCLSICYSKNELFVSCTSVHFVLKACYMIKGTGHIRVFTLSGELLRKIQTDTTGQNLFSEPCNISMSSDGSCLYVADVQIGLIIADRQGNILYVTTDPKLKGTFDVCVADDHRLFVCGRISHNVLLLDKQGHVQREVLKQTDGLLKPVSITHKQNSNQLVVSCENSEKLKVFDIS